ncbi:DoxX family protein [Paucibacter sp. DJ1R-11]|uniref:DoxX family protein n=1 Tax=Paucibacter sp. DJ1R-11 TaxID=2893556 RepID=UPI0021E51277|nr:DoxX family protein [Paucibacter sp. DJ1R-11]MCV2361872.1 DoxX family protein [Paucibacter sp. DJ1R-11]
MNTFTSTFDPQRQQRIMMLLRITLACLVVIHGWTRLLGGSVPSFGRYLDAHGVPFGAFFGYFVTYAEAFATMPLALGRFVFPLSLMFSAIYLVGIPVHHLQYGWFSSGHEDGCEYPTLMVICFALMAWQHAPRSLRFGWPRFARA